jgi:glucose/arabinose dehydrogenase
MRRAPSLLAATAALVLLGACTSDNPSGTPTAPASSPAAAPTQATTRPTATPTASRSLLSGPPKLEKVVDADDPVHLTAPSGDHKLYVVERAGRVIVVDDGKVAAEPFFDISADVRSGGEQGLLSIAFSPSYAEDGLVYAYYTDKAGDSRVVELRRGGDGRVDPGSRRELMKVDQPFANHNGGLLLFDPTGMLLIGLGDGGSGGDPDNRGQDLGDLLGKILRIDPKPSGDKPYGIPRDNPFVGRDGARPEIWAWGLRNPWRFAFDDKGAIYIADVGQGEREEINVVSADAASGANYGWSAFEGDVPFERDRLVGDDHVRPAATYGHEGGRCSVTGGAVYTGSVAELQGHYLYADYCTGEVWAAPVDGTRLGEPRRLPVEGGSVSSFGVDAAGEMYVVSLDGPVYRITA